MAKKSHVLVCNVIQLSRVFIPLYRNGYWYLMIVDMYHGDLVYLDSLKDLDNIEKKKKHMKYVAFFLDTLLEDKGFYKDWDGHTPRNDCGVWVTLVNATTHM